MISPVHTRTPVREGSYQKQQKVSVSEYSHNESIPGSAEDVNKNGPVTIH